MGNGLPQGVLKPPAPIPEDAKKPGISHQAPGTFVLVFVFLAAFILYYFVNWKLLSFIWRIG